MDKKQLQLGMNPSTASHRLIKDTLFRLATDAGHVCFRCGGVLDRESFSLEHKIAWLDSDDPKRQFFDQSNVAFSHLRCNVGDARSVNKGTTKYPQFIGVGKIPPSKVFHHKIRVYDPAIRRAQYERTGT